jgi:transcriptional regulator with AAA-type ATPase domain/Tfp pilus assembly protein PilF
MENTCLKLDRIEKLIEAKNFKQALAEIRDIEAAHALEEGSVEFGHFCYLSAVALRQLGDYKTALSKAQKAFAIYKATGENKRIAKIQYTLGNIYLALGDVGNAKDEFRDSLATYKRIDDEEGILSVLNILARIYFNQSEFETAIRYLSDCIHRCDKIGGKTMKARLFGNLGRIYLLIGKWKEAKENLQISLELNKLDNNLINICCSYLSLGYVSYLLRDFSQSNRYLEDAIKLIFENNYTREFAIYHEYAGELEFAQGNYGKAKNHYLDCIGIMEKIAPEGDMISQSYRLLAELQIAEKQYDEALSSCDKALKVATSLGEKIEIGAIHRALGQIYTAKHQKEKAEENFEKSISILEQIGAKFELGKAYLETLRSDAFGYVDRIAYYARGREIFRELGSDYHIGKITLIFCEFLAESGEYEKAETYFNDSERIFRSLNEERDLTLVQDLKRRISKWLGEPDSSDGSRRSEHRFSDIITQDAHLLALLEQARKFKDSDISILLEGETGTGKDLLAQVIHNESRRKNKRFVKVNCAAIPESLLESELFGHKKGSFTGADKDKRGFFEEADGGTIFLNEIGDLPLRLQAKILDVIEDKEVTRVGEVQPRKVDFRVIAATNRDLSEEVNKGNFRQDLYHRLNVVKLKLPALRERRQDIPLLMKYFLTDSDLGIHSADFDFQPCLEYHWPGNVRELKNEFRKCSSISELIEGMSRLGKTIVKSTSGKLAEIEKAEILEVVKSTTNRSEAAALLGISEATLYRKIRFYRLNQ